MHMISIHQSADWNRFVTGRPDAAYTHLYEWRKVIEKTYGHKSIYLAASEKNKGISAVLPLFCIKRPLGRSRWVSIPFFDRAGVLGDPDAGKFLLEKAGRF